MMQGGPVSEKQPRLAFPSEFLAAVVMGNLLQGVILAASLIASWWKNPFPERLPSCSLEFLREKLGEEKQQNSLMGSFPFFLLSLANLMMNCFTSLCEKIFCIHLLFLLVCFHIQITIRNNSYLQKSWVISQAIFWKSLKNCFNV